MEYQLIRSKRRSLGLEVTPEGKLIVRAPRRLSQKRIDEYLEEKQDWIERSLAKVEERKSKRGDLEPVTEAEKQELRREAKDYMPERIAFFAQQVGVDYGSVSYRFQRSRWGSCSSAGNLNFNCLLLLTPDFVIDYVIVHELCHRLEMNHSPRFWAQVERVLPDYREAKTWLRDNGGDILARLDAGPDQFYTYMVRCADGSYYVGYTDDLDKRVKAHNDGIGAKYTAARRPVELVYHEAFNSKQEAQSREVILKQLSHQDKEDIIKKMNP